MSKRKDGNKGKASAKNKVKEEEHLDMHGG